jgi:hypothetical protein
MDTDNTPRRAAAVSAPADSGKRPTAPATRMFGRSDSEEHIAGGVERHGTVTDTCDACDAVAQVQIVAPCGGVLAFCVDRDACSRRRQRRIDAPPSDRTSDLHAPVSARRST